MLKSGRWHAAIEAVRESLGALKSLDMLSPQAMRQHAAAANLERRGEALPEGYSDQPISDRSPIGIDPADPDGLARFTTNWRRWV